LQLAQPQLQQQVLPLAARLAQPKLPVAEEELESLERHSVEVPVRRKTSQPMSAPILPVVAEA